MRWFEKVATKREPDFIIGGHDTPYVRRWWLIPRNRFFNIYLHYFLRSDEDRAHHDHPWVNLSILLQGEYWEHSIAAGGVERIVHRQAGQFKLRRPTSAHRIVIDKPCWTLFITGPVVRNWGFHCVKGWRPWQQFVDKRDAGSIGRGCD
jgi:hypothetical protein